MKDNKSLLSLIDESLVRPISNLGRDCENNILGIKNFINEEVLKSENKEKMLLYFRRSLEMLIRVPLIVTVNSKTSNKIVIVRKDNFLQLLDDRYYSNFQISSFLNIFKIETNNFKSVFYKETNNEPHIQLLINYILLHYNTTFRKFMNRNLSYYYIYKFFFDYGEDIKYILKILNSYHYVNDEDYQELFNTDFETIKKKIEDIYKKTFDLLDNVCKNFAI